MTDKNKSDQLSESINSVETSVPRYDGNTPDVEGEYRMDESEYRMDESEYKSWMTVLFPDISSEDLKTIFDYANELKADEIVSASDYFKGTFVEFGLAVRQYGNEIALQLLEVCKTFPLNPWEIRDAANSIRNGVSLENIEKIAVGDIGFDLTQEKWMEFEEALTVFEKIAVDKAHPEQAKKEFLSYLSIPDARVTSVKATHPLKSDRQQYAMPLEKESVLDEISKAQKASKSSKKDKPIRKKTGPDL